MDFNCGKTTILPCSNILGFRTDAAMQVWTLCESTQCGEVHKLYNSCFMELWPWSLALTELISCLSLYSVCLIYLFMMINKIKKQFLPGLGKKKNQRYDTQISRCNIVLQRQSRSSNKSSTINDLQTSKALIAFTTLKKKVWEWFHSDCKLFYCSSENNFVPFHSVLLEQSSTR